MTTDVSENMNYEPLFHCQQLSSAHANHVIILYLDCNAPLNRSKLSFQRRANWSGVLSVSSAFLSIIVLISAILVQNRVLQWTFLISGGVFGFLALVFIYYFVKFAKLQSKIDDSQEYSYYYYDLSDQCIKLAIISKETFEDVTSFYVDLQSARMAESGPLITNLGHISEVDFSVFAGGAMCCTICDISCLCPSSAATQLNEMQALQGYRGYRGYTKVSRKRRLEISSIKLIESKNSITINNVKSHERFEIAKKLVDRSLLSRDDIIDITGVDPQLLQKYIDSDDMKDYDSNVARGCKKQPKIRRIELTENDFLHLNNLISGGINEMIKYEQDTIRLLRKLRKGAILQSNVISNPLPNQSSPAPLSPTSDTSAPAPQHPASAAVPPAGPMGPVGACVDASGAEWDANGYNSSYSIHSTNNSIIAYNDFNNLSVCELEESINDDKKGSKTSKGSKSCKTRNLCITAGSAASAVSGASATASGACAGAISVTSAAGAYEAFHLAAGGYHEASDVSDAAPVSPIALKDAYDGIEDIHESALAAVSPVTAISPQAGMEEVGYAGYAAREETQDGLDMMGFAGYGGYRGFEDAVDRVNVGSVGPSGADGMDAMDARDDSIRFPCAYYVVMAPGALAKTKRDMNSKIVCKVAIGTRVIVEEIVGRRARISHPTRGWVSTVTEEGRSILQKEGTQSKEMNDAMRERRTQQTKKIILKSITLMDDAQVGRILAKADWDLRRAIEAFYTAKLGHDKKGKKRWNRGNANEKNGNEKIHVEDQVIRLNSLQNFGLKKYEFANIMMHRINAIKNVGLDNIEIQYQRVVSGAGRLNSMQIEGVSFDNGENDGNGGMIGNNQAVLDVAIARPMDSQMQLQLALRHKKKSRKSERKNNENKSVKSPLLDQDFKY